MVTTTGTKDGFLKRGGKSKETNQLIVATGVARTIRLQLDTLYSMFDGTLGYIKELRQIEKDFPATEELFDSKGKLKLWESHLFKKTPNFQSLLILNTLRTNLANIKYVIINHFKRNTNLEEATKTISILSGNAIETYIRQSSFEVGENLRIEMKPSSKTSVRFDTLTLRLIKEGQLIKLFKPDLSGIITIPTNSTGKYVVEVLNKSGKVINKQNFEVEDRKFITVSSESDKFYVGIDNALITNSNYAEKKLLFELNGGGKIFDKGGVFYASFKKTGAFILKVYNTTTQDSTYLIATKKIIVEPLPIPDVILSNLNGEFIGSKFLSSLKGLKVNTQLKALSEAYKIR
eukprot:gene31448-41934_t